MSVLGLYAVLGGLLIISLSTLVFLALNGFIVSRHLVLKSQLSHAESQIDLLTRQTLQQMRDTVRADLRTPSSSTTIVATVVPTSTDDV